MTGKVILITEDSQGNGKAAAKLLAQTGAKVVIAARKERILQQALAETGRGQLYIWT